MKSSSLDLKRRDFLRLMLIAGLSTQANILNLNLRIKEKLNLIQIIDIRDESTEGGEIRCYSKGNKISKIEIEQCWESGKHYVSILLKQNEPFKVSEMKTHYNVPFNITKELAKEIGSPEYFEEQKSRIIKNTFYFKDNRITDSSTSSEETLHETEILSMEKTVQKRLELVQNKIRNLPNKSET